MPKISRQRYLKIALIFFSAILFFNLIIAPQVKATAPVAVVADVPATVIATKGWLSSAWDTMLNKVATILFQNLLRKYINDLAMDAAKYVAIGAKGQEKLYIEKKWGDHWRDIADQALGDFIEGFANSIISEIAADDIKQEGQAICDKQKQECLDRGDVDCDTPYQECVKNKADIVSLNACDKAFSACQTNCDRSGEEAKAACLNSCKRTRDACKQSAIGSTERARKAPMFQSTNSPLARVNVCNPSLNVSLAISLGLTQYYTGFQTHCSFSEMKKNWVNEYERQKSLMSEDFLRTLATNFHPTGSDLGAAFLLHSDLIEYRGKQVSEDKDVTIANKGWLNVRNFAGGLVGTPGEAEARKNLADQAVWDNLGKISGDILVDAANIFLNQWAISSWSNLMANLSSTSGGGSLSYWSSQQVGRQVIENRLSKLSEPLFSAGGRIDILTKLSVCQNPDKPGPTDCVISNEFSTAVENKMTVIEAVRSGQLPGNWPFGFNKNGEDEIVYNQGYPYRSLIILRKYRILPVGWEVAAQAIQKQYLDNNPIITTDFPNGVTLNDLLACYSPNDGVNGYNDDGRKIWCAGLVDPNWVLKVPEYYCAREGNGPELLMEPNLVGTGARYCSADKGQTRTIVKDDLGPCETLDDCCTDAELAIRDKLTVRGKEKELRNFSCAATCSYNEQKILVNRKDSYCADEQGCLKEGRNGSCLFYGYCAEEKRSWLFNKEKKDEACSPLFNTCQAFKKANGQNVSYLANTLDYDCEQSAIGCKEYSYNGLYDAGNDTLAWDKSQSIYLNRKTGACDSKQEGCREFIRVKDNAGVNLLADGGLEAYDKARWSDFGEVVENKGNNLAYQGGFSLKVETDNNKRVYYGPGQQSLLPKGFVFATDNFYTLSAYVYVVAGEVTMAMGSSADPNAAQIIRSTAVGEWQNLVLAILNDDAAKADGWEIRGAPGTVFFVDNLKFELGNGGKYSAYRADNLLYEKLLPSYLEPVCYREPGKDFNFKNDAPAKCFKFARKCQADEVGCELYTEVNTKDVTAAQVKSKDYCPKECVGYDAFIQLANNFYSARDEYFIPKTAKTCRAAAVGCSLFVNLDKVKSGGEENEYFAKFRRCGQPDDVFAEFYTWEGSNESGYQLMVYQLLANTDTTSGISQPATIDDTDTTDDNDGDTCNEEIYALPYDHPQYNSDCRQFYGRDGNVSYHLMAQTVTYSKECHPYRLVANNIDVTITDRTKCEDKQGHWDAGQNNCVVCINGGVWMDEHQACVYLADPTKSQTCAASEVGCSEYEGDFGNQVKIILYDTFENGKNGWGPPTSKISSDSLTVGGHSLQMNDDPNGSAQGWFEKSVQGKLRLGKRYVLSFVAKKKKDDAWLERIRFGRVAGSSFNSLLFADKVDLSPDWKQYKFDVQITSQAELDSAESLVIYIGGRDGNSVRLDNIKLLETSDTHYLIKNSWKTPASCNQDLLGNTAPLYMLGCKQYSDRDNKTHYLKSFDKLCQDSAVGCELMIDTHNSSFYGAETFGPATDPVTVPADNLAYIVYEKSKECNLADKGCARLGQYDDLAEAHKDVYLLNNPDRYKDILCAKKQVGCEAWGLAGGGEAYFKDPGVKTCEFRQPAGGGGPGWYMIKVNRCVSTANKACAGDAECGNGRYCATIGQDNNGAIKRCASKFSCEAAADCPAGTSCQAIKTDEPCPFVAYSKTIGLGVRDEKIQPLGMAEKDPDTGKIGNAGLCPANQNSCTEYIDPESSFSYNLLTRANSVIIKPDTLYILKNKGGEATVTCAGGGVYRLRQDNTVDVSALNDTIRTVKQSEEFYVDGDVNARSLAKEPVSCTVSPAVGTELKEAIVNYRLKDSLNQDKPNTVNPGKGQVLFNERSFDGGRYNPLVWDVNASGVNQDGSEQAPQTAVNGNENNANALLKVDPDRQCSAWLGCKSYTENPNKPGEKICYERGLCDQMNEAGECINFISKDPPVNQTYDPILSPDISNLTGYAKVGYLDNIWNADMYHLAAMKQEGDTKVKFDGSFENAWETDFVDFATGQNRASIVSDAKIIERELGFGGYKIIPDGRAMGKTNTFVVKEIKNAGNRQYVVSAYVFLRYGSQVELTAGRNFKTRDSGPCPFESVNDSTDNLCNGGSYAVVASTGVAGRWVRLVGKFSIANSYQGSGERDTRITIGLKPVNGLAYFDDVRLEPGLNYKQQSGTGLEQYLHSDCRLYPERDSMSCDYYDDSGLRKKGWAGYCLEYDPKNPAVCLLWYPIDKVESEEYEEGVALNFLKDMYYCVDSEDGCRDDNQVEPEFFCKKFIKVDKEKYWYDRLIQGSGYVIPFDLLTNDPKATSSAYFYADFGVNAGGRASNIELNQKAGSGYYGAYSSQMPPYLDKLGVGNTAGKVMSFVPFHGYSNAGAGNKNYYCRATLDANGHDQPIEIQEGRGSGDSNEQDLGQFDNCYIGVATQWPDCGDGQFGKGICCSDWAYLNRHTPRGACSAETEHWTDFNNTFLTNGSWGGEWNCTLWPHLSASCDVKPVGNSFVGKTGDTCGDNSQTSCFFDCYNHTKFYRVAQNQSRALNAVKRLFTSVDSYNPCYIWNSGGYFSETDPAKCGLGSTGVDFSIAGKYCFNNVRPIEYNPANDNDYCLVRPTVPEVTLNVKPNGSNYLLPNRGWVAINFSSQVDKEQLPLRKYVINWGYQHDNFDVTLVRNVNMNSRPDIKNGHQAYYFVDYKEVQSGGADCGNTQCPPEVTVDYPNANCCVINPFVTLTDNWGVSNASSNGLLDHSLIVYDPNL